MRDSAFKSYNDNVNAKLLNDGESSLINPINGAASTEGGYIGPSIYSRSLSKVDRIKLDEGVY
jgi:hypothetical protein